MRPSPWLSVVLKTWGWSTTCLLLVAKTALTLLANPILKRWDAVFAKVTDSISFELFVDLRNAPLSGLSGSFLKEAVKRAFEKSHRVLHDEAIRKSVSQYKLAKKPTKQLQFSQSSRKPQSSKHSAPQSSGKSSGRGLSSAPSPGSKAPSSSFRCGRGKEIWRFITSHSCR